MSDFPIEKSGANQVIRVGAIETFLSTLSLENETELKELCRNKAIPLPVIHAFLQGLGYTGTIYSVGMWLQTFRRQGSVAKQLNLVAEQYDGIDIEASLSKVLGDTMKEIERVSDEVFNRLEEVDPNVMLKTLPLLRREARTAGESLNQLKYIRLKTEAEMAGASTMAEGLKEIFLGTPFYSALEMAIKAMYSRMLDQAEKEK